MIVKITIEAIGNGFIIEVNYIEVNYPRQRIFVERLNSEEGEKVLRVIASQFQQRAYETGEGRVLSGEGRVLSGVGEKGQEKE